LAVRKRGQCEVEGSFGQSCQRREEWSGKATRSSQGVGSFQMGQGTAKWSGPREQVRGTSREGEECEERREQGQGRGSHLDTLQVESGSSGFSLRDVRSAGVARLQNRCIRAEEGR
jgi:hypothetical protein